MVSKLNAESLPVRALLHTCGLGATEATHLKSNEMEIAMLSRSPVWLLRLASLVPCVSSLAAHSQTSREETKMELRSRRHPLEEGH